MTFVQLTSVAAKKGRLPKPGDADNMDETDDLARRQDASQYNRAEDARPDLRGISASVAARRMSALGH